MNVLIWLATESSFGSSRSTHHRIGPSGPLCNVALVKSASKAECIEGRSFGCEMRHGRPTVWVRNCRGNFRCAGHNRAVPCGFPPGQASYECHCDGSRRRAAPRLACPEARPSLNRSFASAADLGEWEGYLSFVYGLDTIQFPLHLSALHFFYRDRLPGRVLQSLQIIEAGSPCPIKSGDLYSLGGLLSAAHVYRCRLRQSCRAPSGPHRRADLSSFEPDPTGLPSHSFAEVAPASRARVSHSWAQPSPNPTPLRRG